MQRVLRKRVIRDLRENFFRYLALGLMIAMGIFLVVTIVGSGETLTRGTERIAEETNLEDGEFEVFVPLTGKDKDGIADLDIEIEEQFYFDYQMNDENDGTVRIFKIRSKINTIQYIDGDAPQAVNDIVVEKRYAEEHSLFVGGTMNIAGVDYKISAIGIVSDYDGPFKEISDTSVNSKTFGVVFFTEDAYSEFRNSGRSQKSENYLYSYKLGNTASDKELKDYLKELKIEAAQVDDYLFQEYWDRTGGVEESLRDAVKELREATDEVRDGLDELSENNRNLRRGAEEIFKAYLKETEKALREYGPDLSLTENNFEDEIDNLISKTDSAFMKLALEDAENQLKDLRDYKDGISEYTGGVEELYDGLDEMSDGVRELDESVNDALDEFDFELSNLTMFMKQSDNPRIYATKNDKIVDIEVGIAAGIILLILFAYVISVFVVHSIESESSIIGTLYSMGVTKNDLMLHYITLPVIVTFISGLIGSLIASTGVMAPMIAESSYSYFSIPTFNFEVPGYLWIYSLVFPPVIAIIVNVLVIRSKLNRTALSLIRNENKQTKVRKLNLKGMNFVTAFRIRQMLREMRSSLTVVLGMFFSLLVFMISVDCYLLCTHIAADYLNDTKFEYMYTLKYPEEAAPGDAEPAFAYTCKKNTMGFNFDVTILGIDTDNPYFKVNTEKSKVDIVISSAFAEKFNLSKGDEFIVTDEDKEIKYAFSVKDIYKYSSGFFIFMDIDEMRDMMGEANDYYNVLFTNEELDIDSGRVYSVTTRDDIARGASVFTELMMPMIYTITFAAMVIFCVVMYLMMKVMIDRSAYNISLIKVFGYKKKEIKKLYLDGNFYVIAIGALICLPLSKLLMDKMFPFMISNVACGMNLDTPPMFFIVAYIVILLLYFMINALLVRRLNKFTPAEVLKNRE